jgi:hypothetical protein
MCNEVSVDVGAETFAVAILDEIFFGYNPFLHQTLMTGTVGP